MSDQRASMRERLTRENLHGIWAALPTPFDARDRVDEDVLRENVRRLAAAGVHGIYITDADGEFYALELDEFRQLVDVFADEAQRAGIPTQAGVTWCNTEGMVARLRHCAGRGILGAHVGHPFYMPMTPEAYRAFWEDMRRAVPEDFALIHYNTPRVHNYQHGADYARLLEEVPNLVGTKHVGASFPEFQELMACSGQLSHFTGEHAMTPFMLFGARGVYSWFACFNPRYMLDWYAEIRAGEWVAARQRQERLHAFSRAKRILEECGNYHAIVGKAMAEASPFLLTANRTRRPYLPVSEEAVQRFQRTVEAELPDLLWRPAPLFPDAGSAAISQEPAHAPYAPEVRR